MKRIFVFLMLFIGTAAVAHTINWHVDGNIFHTTTCESGEDITPPTAPEKYGYTFKEWGAYIPIEYLESTGTQWIDTGYVPNTNTKVSIKLQFTTLPSDDIFQALLGARNKNRSYSFSIFIAAPCAPVVDKNHIRFDLGHDGSNTCASYDNLTHIGDAFNLTKNGAENYINGKQFESNVSANFSAPFNAYLFALNEADNPIYPSTVRIYSTQIWDNNILIRDFIPVLDKNGTPCLYDKVEGKLYYNAGTGDFIAGPVIGE